MFPAERAPRRAGVIMHPTSLPGLYGIGDMGAEAYAFVDWLFDAKMQIWQVTNANRSPGVMLSEP